MCVCLYRLQSIFHLEAFVYACIVLTSFSFGARLLTPLRNQTGRGGEVSRKSAPQDFLSVPRLVYELITILKWIEYGVYKECIRVL